VRRQPSVIASNTQKSSLLSEIDESEAFREVRYESPREGQRSSENDADPYSGFVLDEPGNPDQDDRPQDCH
jgi:hypothetical protein